MLSESLQTHHDYLYTTVQMFGVTLSKIKKKNVFSTDAFIDFFTWLQNNHGFHKITNQHNSVQH